MRLRYRIALPLFLGLALLDQLTKLWVAQALPLGTGKTVIPGFFNLVHVLNRGAAFSFLNRGDIEWQRYFFICASVAALVLLAWFLVTAKHRNRLLFFGLGAVAGGALGNLIDRVRTGQVVDFLDFYVSGWHWPAFNVADSAITVGAAALFWTMWKHGDKTADR